MGQLLKYAGLFYTLWRLYGDRVTSAVFDRIEYDFSPIRAKHIRPDVTDEGKLLALVRIELRLKQTFGVNLFAQRLQLQLSQQGEHLGRITVNEPVSLPNATTTPIPVDAIIPAGDFLNRLFSILKDPANRAMAPIDIRGTLTLSNGIDVPVFTSLDLTSL